MIDGDGYSPGRPAGTESTQNWPNSGINCSIGLIGTLSRGNLILLHNVLSNALRKILSLHNVRYDEDTTKECLGISFVSAWRSRRVMDRCDGKPDLFSGKFTD